MKSYTAWRLATTVAAALASLSLIASAFFFYEISTRATDIRTSQVESCHRVGDPIRDGLVTLLEDQIAQSRRVDYSRFFPGVPKKELDRLIAAQNQRRQVIVDELNAAPPCEDRF